MTSYLPQNIGQWMRRMEQRLSILERRRPPAVQSGAGTLVELGAGVDLDTIVATGAYVQQRSADASLALNYPAASAGMLEVFMARHPDTDEPNMIWQRYTLYLGNNERQIYMRGFYGGTTNTWSEWQENLDVDSDWIPLPLNSPFVQFSSTYPTMYRKIGKLVKLRGLLRYNASDPWPASAAVEGVFTMPPGFRPPNNEFFAGPYTTGAMPGTIVMSQSGVTDVRTGSTGWPANYISLSNVMFFTDD